MIVYTYSEARRKLATLLDQAINEGEVWIRRRDGQSFVIRPEKKADSLLRCPAASLTCRFADLPTRVPSKSG